MKTKVIAIRLSDGGYDGNLYDSKREAVKHQSDEFLCAYVFFRNLMGGASPREMEIFLKWNRDAYDAGFRLPDPMEVNGGPDVLMTSSRYDEYSAKLPKLSPAEMKMASLMIGLPKELVDEMERIITS